MLSREELIKLKKEKSLSVIKLSELSGVPVGTITKIISGETKKPRADTIRALEAILLDKREVGDLYPKDVEENFTHSYMPDPVTANMVCERAVSYGVPKKKQGEYTFEDLNCLPEGRYVELIDGVIYDMATPTYRHQMAAMDLYYQIRKYIEADHGQCIAFVNAFGVFADNDKHTYLIPDVSVVCDRDKIKEDGIHGAPDFVIEILSPSTASKDKNHKFYKYSQCGVREYWMLDLEKKLVVAYRFEKDYKHYIGPIEGKLAVEIYDGKLEINLDEIAKVLG